MQVICNCVKYTHKRIYSYTWRRKPCVLDTLFSYLRLTTNSSSMYLRFLLAFFCFVFAVTIITAQPIFLEEDGIVRIDVESAGDQLGDWVVRTDLSGFIGESYLEFEGPNFFNQPGNSVLLYKVRISTPGTYQLRWHSRITEANENTDFNDSWVRFPDADLVYGERGGSRVYPHGSGMSPTPEGSGSNNWMKAYQNRSNEWFWGVFTSDNAPHDIYAEFLSPGDYTIEISGRSTGHAIDRFVLVHADASLSVAQSLSAPESDQVTNSISSISPTLLEITPNPSADFVDMALPATVPPGTYRIIVHDMSGRPVGRFSQFIGAEQPVRIPVEDYPAGTYLLTVEAGDKVYTGKFVR